MNDSHHFSDYDEGSSGSHVFSEMCIHATWHCHEDRKLITPEIEAKLFEYLESNCRKIKGIHIKAINGTSNHVHIVFMMEPFVLLSAFLGKLKGGSSREINKIFGEGTMRWQRGYGVVTFSMKHLPAVIKYVENQKEHHRLGKLNKILEKHTI